MLRRAAAFGLALLLWACTDRVMLYDAVDASTPDLIPDLSSAADIPRDALEPNDGPCRYRRLETIPPPSPRIVILLDRSSSMQEPFGSTTREAASKSALLDAVKKYQWRVGFGFEQFPADGSDDAYYDCQRGYCCAGPVEIWPGTRNYDIMKEAVQCSERWPCAKPSYGSPSNAALAEAKEFFSKSKSVLSDNSRFALLVTSSEPDCTVGFASGAKDACEDAVEAASALYSMGVGVAVLAVGYQAGPTSCLTQISQSGDLALSTYTPMTEKDLSSDVDDLVWRVASPTCTVELEYAPPVQPVVSLDNTPIGEDEENGWSFADFAHTSITLSGWACDRYLRSSSTLYVGYCQP